MGGNTHVKFDDLFHTISVHSAVSVPHLFAHLFIGKDVAK